MNKNEIKNMISKCNSKSILNDIKKTWLKTILKYAFYECYLNKLNKNAINYSDLKMIFKNFILNAIKWYD